MASRPFVMAPSVKLGAVVAGLHTRRLGGGESAQAARVGREGLRRLRERGQRIVAGVGGVDPVRGRAVGAGRHERSPRRVQTAIAVRHAERQFLRLLLEQQVLRPDLLIGRHELRELLLQLARSAGRRCVVGRVVHDAAEELRGDGHGEHDEEHSAERADDGSWTTSRQGTRRLDRPAAPGPATDTP